MFIYKEEIFKRFAIASATNSVASFIIFILKIALVRSIITETFFQTKITKCIKAALNSFFQAKIMSASYI